MNRFTPQDSGPYESFRSRWSKVVVIGCLIVFLISLFRGLYREEIATDSDESSARGQRGAVLDRAENSHAQVRLRRASAAPAPSAEEEVAGKVREFGRSRREII